METAMQILSVYSPYDRRLVRELPLATDRDADDAIRDARETFLDRSKWLPKHERIRILTAFKSLLSQNADALVGCAIAEGGKPLADTKVEMARALGCVDIAIAELRGLHGSEIPMGLSAPAEQHLAYTMLEPAGVVVAISAFNHPINLIVHQVLPAVAAGCPVIVKPADTTPSACLRIVELLVEAGLSRPWCRAIVCSRETTARMAADSRIAFVSFIGSAAVGWGVIRKNLAPGVRCSLEHGGSAPAIVEPDADLDAILPGLVKAGYYHAGQVCISLKRLFVHRAILPALLERMTSLVKSLRVGDPADAATEVGPLIHPREVDRVDTWVQEAVREGATLLCGGEKASGAGTCYRPTLLLNPSVASRVFADEVFGPVVSLIEYEDRLDAIRLANSLPFCFQASVFTRSLDTALDTARRLKARTVLINEHTTFRVDWMPFGGAEMSGLGTGGIGYALRELCSEKLLVIRSAAW